MVKLQFEFCHSSARIFKHKLFQLRPIILKIHSLDTVSPFESASLTFQNLHCFSLHTVRLSGSLSVGWLF